MNTSATQLSLAMQTVAAAINEFLTAVAGKEVAFVLVLQDDDVAQYVSNASRADGTALLESLLARWQANRADIPAHYNPDLQQPHAGESPTTGAPPCP